MTNRAQAATAFLAETDWADADRRPLAGDASNRRYERLHMADGRSAVFMDAPPDKGEDVRPFVQIATYLREQGLSAPAVLFQDTVHGFLILEDLGDALFARVLARDPGLEPELYTAATDALIALHQADPPPLPVYSPDLMTDLAALAFDRYKAGIEGGEVSEASAAFKRAFRPLLQATTGGPQVLIQRDYHAENLLWLPDRVGVRRVGMLDFQDAHLGHPAYDLVSVLQDARRDVAPNIEQRMIDHYMTATGVDADSFLAAYAALGVQRNLRILGVFARLSLDHNKSHYVDLIPRVWDFVTRNLKHPALADVAEMIQTELPSPSVDNLRTLKTQ